MHLCLVAGQIIHILPDSGTVVIIYCSPTLIQVQSIICRNIENPWSAAACCRLDLALIKRRRQQAAALQGCRRYIEISFTKFKLMWKILKIIVWETW